MKWIKSRNRFINEAKIRDLILPRQAKEVASVWGEKWLDLEEVEACDNIKQGRWKLTEEDKIQALSEFLMADLKSIYDTLDELPDKLNEIIKLSVKPEILTERLGRIMQNFDIKKLSIDQICVLTDPVFRKISVGETQATEILLKDESGRPIMDESGLPKKVSKRRGEVIFTKNLVNINTFIDDFNRCYPDNAVDAKIFSSGEIQKAISTSKENMNPGYEVDFSIYDKDMYLSIKHDPKDILNMSISKFYSSCQHLYTGCYRGKVFGNVLDPNSIPAFIIFDTPIMMNNEKISDTLPICRMMIRNIEKFDEKNPKSELFFDRAYPDRMKSFMDEIITKYSNNKSTIQPNVGVKYLFSPDIPDDSDEWRLEVPYMDRLGLETGKYIGVNTKYLSISAGVDWSRVRISPKSKIDELIIETTEIPENLLSLNLNPKWVKFRFLKINSLFQFNKIKSKSYAFEKCKFNGNIISDILQYNPDVEGIQIIACDVNNISFMNFKSLKELHLLFSINDEKLRDLISGIKLNKLVLSSDVILDKENNSYISELRKSGTIVSIIGPKI